MYSVNSICLQLKEHNMKTTVEAISKVLEISPKQVISNKRQKNQLYSCIVDQIEAKTDNVIFDYNELEAWLEKEENKSNASKEMIFLIENMVN